MDKLNKEYLIEELIEACQFALDTYNNITSEDFRLGNDKPARDKLEFALSLAADYEDQSLITFLTSYIHVT